MPTPSKSAQHPRFREEVLTKARKLLELGWRTNVTAESVTRQSDQRAGLVEQNVWNAMNYLLAEKRWIQTEPQRIAPTGTWESSGL